MSWLVVAPVMLPLAAAVAALGARRHAALARAIELVTASALAAIAACLLWLVWNGGPLTVHVGDWPAGFAIPIVADHAAVAMVALAAFVVLVVLAQQPTSHRGATRTPLVLALVAGVNGALLAGDLFNLYVWFEVMVVASLGLLITQGGRPGLRAARHYAAMHLLASALLLIGVAMVYGATGTVQLDALAGRFAQLAASQQVAIAGLFLVAFGVKAAAFPVFAWLPPAYAALPMELAALYSALLTKVGIYALARVLGAAFASAAAAAQPALVVIACVTMVAGVLCALAQMDVRRLLAFHIVSQIGYLLLVVALFEPVAGAALFFFAIHVACAKAALFLVAGWIARAGGSYDLRELGGLFRARPWLAVAFAVPALALAGVPPLSGFWAKLFVLQAALGSAEWLAAAIALAVSVLTLMSMAKIWMYAFWRDAPGAMPAAAPRPGLGDRVATGGVIAATVVFGLVPAPLYDLALRAAADIASGAGAR